MQDEVGVHMMQRQQDLHKEVQDGLLLQQGITALLDELSQGATCSRKELVKIQASPCLRFSFYETKDPDRARACQCHTTGVRTLYP